MSTTTLRICVRVSDRDFFFTQLRALEDRARMRGEDFTAVQIECQCKKTYTYRSVEDVPASCLKCDCGTWLFVYTDEEVAKSIEE